MKKILAMLMCLLCTQFVLGQVKTNVADSIKGGYEISIAVQKEVKKYNAEESLLRAARYQSQSAKYSTLSILCALAGTTVVILGSDNSKYYVAGGLAAASIASEFYSIYLRHKSGVCLEAGVGGIRLNF